MQKASSFFSNLKCRECGQLYPKQAIHVCDFDFGPLEAAYDYAAIQSVLTRKLIESRPQTMWRYRELLPIDGEPTVGTQVAGVPAHAWDMKALHKLIVTSAAYRQSAKVTRDLLEKDPENRLLARGPRLRLSAEQLRDSALAVSGLLVEKPGGASVRPYMPAKVWDETSVYGDLLNYKHATDENLYRRTVYTIWKRTAAPPTSLAFDAPNRETCTVKRSRTNTPLQALAMLNEVTFVEAARKLAETMIREGGATAPERIQWAFRKAANRPAQASEVKLLESGLERQLVRFQQNPEAATKLLGFGESKSPADIPAAQLAAYTITANVLLNIDEFITR